MSHSRIGVGLVCVLAISFAAVAQAGTIPTGQPIGPPVRLDQLLGPDGGSIQVGDKLFDDFSYSSTGDMPPADRVNVAPFVDLDGNFGIQITGAFRDEPDAPGPNFASDAVIQYSVWVTDPNPQIQINDVHLYGQMDATGDGSVLITESYSNTSPGFLSVYYERNGATVNGQLSDWMDLPNTVRHLRVKKNISANALTGVAAVTIIEQTFSQIPEPSTAMLTLLVGACFCGSRRRRTARG
jgi:hypothetical protein